MADMITVRELGERMKLSLKSAYRLTQEPGFPVCRAGGKILIPLDLLQEWIKQGGSAERRDENGAGA